MRSVFALFVLGVLSLCGCDDCKRVEHEKTVVAPIAAAEAPAANNEWVSLPGGGQSGGKKRARAAAAEKKWTSLFDGKTLGKWKETQFGGQSNPKVENGNLVVPVGESLSGVTYSGDDFPRMDYEIELEAQRVDGSDFFCALTFPVGKTHASLVLGGWGGSICGISSLDGDDAARNETTKFIGFEAKKWYRVKMRVEKDRLQAFLDDQMIVNISTEGRKVDVRIDIAQACPLGLSTYQTTGAFRNIRIWPLDSK